MARARTVLTPTLPPRERKPKAGVPAPEWRPRPGQPCWRVREPGETNPKRFLYCGTYEDAEGMAGPDSIIETLRNGIWGRRPRLVPTVAELAEQGMAREVVVGNSTRWAISPLGQQVLNDAMMGLDE